MRLVFSTSACRRPNVFLSKLTPSLSLSLSLSTLRQEFESELKTATSDDEEKTEDKKAE